MYLIGLIMILLDGIIIYFTKAYFNDLNYFYPMLTLTYIILIYENNDKYLKKSFILGFIYDLFYSSIFLFNSLIFLLLSKINRKIFKIIRPNLLNKTFILIINIILYDTINFLIIYLSSYNKVSLYDLFYKVSHSLILNILSLFVLHFILKKSFLRHKIKW